MVSPTGQRDIVLSSAIASGNAPCQSIVETNRQANENEASIYYSARRSDGPS
jgi:hypothetical protein